MKQNIKTKCSNESQTHHLILFYKSIPGVLMNVNVVFQSVMLMVLGLSITLCIKNKMSITFHKQSTVDILIWVLLLWRDGVSLK